MKRVYHPTLNTWADVPEAAVDTWLKAGWKKAPQKHTDDSDAHGVGEFWSADVARPEPIEPKPEPEPTAESEKPAEG